MSKKTNYCDTKKLEHNWFKWLVASSVPDLELYRQKNLLWTKIIGDALDNKGNPIVKGNKRLLNPIHPIRMHCIATGSPIYFTSNNGQLPNTGILSHDGKFTERPLPELEELSLLSESEIHRLDNPFIQYDEVIPKLISDGYFLEQETNTSWHVMLEDIKMICEGIAKKFNLKCDEAKNELINNAMVQVMRKLKQGKLIYMPGRAPVFNLLTTTIIRCMYSIMNQATNQRKNQSKLIEGIISGSVKSANRSFRIEQIKDN